jgi:hypothetical protein
VQVGSKQEGVRRNAELLRVIAQDETGEEEPSHAAGTEEDDRGQADVFSNHALERS